MTESIQVGQTVPEFVMDIFEPERGEFGELRPRRVCPAEWKEEGDVTLTPGAEMVGRVHEALSQGGRVPGREGR